MNKKKIICHDLHNNQIEVRADKLIFRPSIYGILIEKNKVLLSKQWDGYDLPGGGVYIYETLEQALKREFFEETGINVELIAPVHCETSFFCPSYSKKHKDQYWNCPLIYCLVKKVGGRISKDNLDEEEQKYTDMPEWIDLDKISRVKFYNSIDNEKVIKKAFEIYKKITNR